MVFAEGRHLEQLGLADAEVGAALRSGRVQAFDARATLALFVRDGMVSAPDFEREIANRVCEAARGGRRVWAFGSMVDVLWRDGCAGTALELEGLWNALGRRTDLQLMCGYSKSNFVRDSAHGENIADVCRVHSHVVPAQRLTPVPLRTHG